LVAAAGSAQPHLARGTHGTIVLSWLEPDDDGVVLYHSTLQADRWQAKRPVARGNDWFVNWADFPSVVPISPTRWAAHWLVKRPGGTYAYDVALALSEDTGQTWSEPLSPHTDNTPTEHGFVSLYPHHDGVGALWLDGRLMHPDEQRDEHEHGAAGGMTLRTAVVAADRSLSLSQQVDDLVCDCCQTDVAAGPEGPIAVYRNRTPQEIRDIYVARMVNGRWEEGRPVARDGWHIDGCPVNGPAIASDGERVAVAWFTAANDTPRVRLAMSTDGAQTFSPPIDIDTQRPEGRVDVALLDNGNAVVSWLRAHDEGELCLRQVTATGKTGPIHVIAPIHNARSSGFPQLVRDADHLVLAWTDVSGDASQVRSVRVDIASLPR
jgi:hypothetical protein